MNYEQLNRVYDFWRDNIVSNLSTNMMAPTFEEYLRRFSFLPAGKWLRDMEVVKLSRLGFAVDSKKFVEKYKSYCVCYNNTSKPEDGIQKVIYQFSPTLHAEMALWIWIENDILRSYCSLFFCYHDEKEFLSLSDDLKKTMRLVGNTEDNPNKKVGFAELAGFNNNMISALNQSGHQK